MFDVQVHQTPLRNKITISIPSTINQRLNSRYEGQMEVQHTGEGKATTSTLLNPTAGRV